MAYNRKNRGERAWARENGRGLVNEEDSQH